MGNCPGDRSLVWLQPPGRRRAVVIPDRAYSPVCGCRDQERQPAAQCRPDGRRHHSSEPAPAVGTIRSVARRERRSDVRRAPLDQSREPTADGLEVRFTRQGSALYATLFGTPTRQEISIPGLTAGVDTTVQRLGSASPLAWRQNGDNLIVTLPSEWPESPAHCLKITPASVVET